MHGNDSYLDFFQVSELAIILFCCEFDKGINFGCESSTKIIWFYIISTRLPVCILQRKKQFKLIIGKVSDIVRIINVGKRKEMLA